MSKVKSKARESSPGITEITTTEIGPTTNQTAKEKSNGSLEKNTQENSSMA